MSYELTQADAMIVALVTVEAFCSLPSTDEMPQEVGRGTLLLFEAIMSRIKPLLPKTDEFQHVHLGIRNAEVVADLMCQVYGWPRKIS